MILCREKVSGKNSADIAISHDSRQNEVNKGVITMFGNLFKSLFSGSEKKAEQVEPTEYKGYLIYPEPVITSYSIHYTKLYDRECLFRSGLYS